MRCPRRPGAPFRCCRCTQGAEEQRGNDNGTNAERVRNGRETYPCAARSSAAVAAAAAMARSPAVRSRVSGSAVETRRPVLKRAVATAAAMPLVTSHRERAASRFSTALLPLDASIVLRSRLATLTALAEAGASTPVPVCSGEGKRYHTRRGGAPTDTTRTSPTASTRPRAGARAAGARGKEGPSALSDSRSAAAAGSVALLGSRDAMRGGTAARTASAVARSGGGSRGVR